VVALAVIALPCLLYSMDLTVLFLALPRLTADLRPSGAQLLWITDSYGFMLAGFLITMGTRRRPDRSPAAAADRRRRLRGRFTTGRVREQRRDADRGARSARDRCGNPGALDLVVDPGLHVAAIVGAALAIAIAIVSAKVLRRAQPAPEADTDPPPRKNDRPRRRSRRTSQAAETAAAAIPIRRKEVPDGPSGS
jgi:hypothetical protein